jgi:hypothetical protein
MVASAPEALRVLALATLSLTFLSCIKTVEETNRPCPCAADWSCCVTANVCVPAGTGCPDGECTEGSCPAGQECASVHRCGVVVPGAGNPAKVMLAIDRSGSMKTRPDDDAIWGCCVTGNGGSTLNTACTGYDPSGQCKWNNLKELLVGQGQFLDQMAGNARFGLALFPGEQVDSCAGGKVEVEVSASADEGNRGAIQAALDQLSAAGGTPTTATLQAIAANPGFTRVEPRTKSFVVLMTDGAPNCNPRLDSATCTCTGPNCADPALCLDDAGLVQAISDLHAGGIDTFVVWFGVVQDYASDTLNRAAVAGGRARSGDPKYYAVRDGTDLAPILDQIHVEIRRCIYPLSKEPQYPDSLQVVLTDARADGGSADTTLAHGTDWDYTDPTDLFVEIKGATCEHIDGAEDGRYQLTFLQMVPL